jgi:uncharacterized protein
MIVKKKSITWAEEENPKNGERKSIDFTASLEMEVYPLPKTIIAERDVFITMRDGVRLCVNVFRPDKTGKFPVIMAFVGPYGKDSAPQEYSYGRYDYFVDLGLDVGKFRISEATPFEGPDPGYWVPNDYVVIHLDTRGFFKSEGEKQIHSTIETEDYFEIIEWAGTREWSNGNVGLSGVSYLAVSQYYAASLHPPHLKAISPWEGFSDEYRDRRFPGGVPESTFSLEWKKRNVPGTMTEAEVSAFLDPVSNRNLMNGAPELEKIHVPALICASWSDHGLHTRGSFEVFKRISSEQRWLYTHGRKKWEAYYSDDALTYQKRFFDHFLKDIDNGMGAMPRVRLEVRETKDTCAVRDENEWPLTRTQYKKLFLDANGTLIPDKASQEGKMRYDSSTGKAEFILTFDRDTELSGHMKLKLWVSADEGDDMDLLVGVKKIDSSGEEVHFIGTAMSGYVKGIVARGWLRVSLRELDENKSTPWQPILKHQKEKRLKPGEIVPVEIEILPSSTLFRKGESMKLVIQGRDLIDGPPWGWLGFRVLINKGVHTIHVGGDFDSHLLVPVIP